MLYILCMLLKLLLFNFMKPKSVIVMPDVTTNPKNVQ